MGQIKGLLAAVCTAIGLLLPAASPQTGEQGAAELHYTVSDEKLYVQTDNIGSLWEKTVLIQDNGRDKSKSGTEYALLCGTADGSVQLYAVSGSYTGVICRWDGLAQYFPWDYRTPRRIAPELRAMQGGREMYCVVNSGSGTGVSLYDLHILTVENGRITEKYLSYDTFSEALEAAMGDVSQSGQTLSFCVDGRTCRAELPSAECTIKGISCGQNINSLTCKDGVLTVGGMVEAYVGDNIGICYLGTLQAAAEIQGDGVQLSDFQWFPEE